MPLLFAVTLFVSASLLFMVQPMVGKLVLPLLGGSPAVWNACMVFFQALLLLGYLYADRITRQSDTRKQWVIHMGVMALPVAAFVLSVLFSSRGTPISAAESLAPSDGSSAILGVLAILSLCIGVPFFVVSTSATLLQKWFTYTGHPSARDPYFLYAASNFGSLISLLGYPIFIEPNMTQGMQTWFWAVGFVALFALIAFCGRAAVNPLGVPPGGTLATATAGAGSNLVGKQAGRAVAVAAAPKPVVTDNKVVPVAPPVEPPPTWARMAKWTVLAFVPSSLMLGVTFYMTTDIASIPLLWVGPLALYLVTFIIAFGRTPPWFRILIGNLAPVMILLLVFLLISNVDPGIGIKLLLHNLTFFAAALMCHYELARDRPAPRYLTTYFLIMSFGGVLGGIFNSLLAPVVFQHAYEYPLALLFACLMVPNLNPLTQDDGDAKMSPEGALAAEAAIAGATNPIAYAARWVFRFVDRNKEVAIALDVIVPVLVGIGFWQLRELSQYKWYGDSVSWLSEITADKVSRGTIVIVVTYALPVMVCFFFVDRPLRFALCVAAILGPVTYKEYGSDALHTERSFFGILKIEEHDNVQYLVDRTRFDTVTDEALAAMRKVGVPEPVVQKLAALKDQEMPRHTFEKEVENLIGPSEFAQNREKILRTTFSRENPGTSAVKDADGKPIVLGRYEYHRLVHGTTLHGTQVARHERHILDDFQFLTAANPWDNLAVMGAIQTFDMRQEPLTYYHRTGPVGAMFAELSRPKPSRPNRGKEPPHVAMVGLGTGSVSCYAQKGQRLTFYEIDPTVKKLVADSDKYFSYVRDARNRGAELDFRMGDARLKLKATDDKYALLLIDAFSSDSIPVHLLTVEAVELYLERLADDGILALHISNKFVRLEPVVAAIAEKLGLVARVWNDDAEGRHGKTASSWVALARKREHLGDRLCSPISDLMLKFGDEQIYEVLRYTYPELKAVLDKNPAKQQETILQWLDKRTDDPQAKEFATWIRKYGSEYESLMTVLQRETGYGFRPVRVLKGVDAWTDDYADVMRVMMIPELQKVRKFFGLPTPVER